MISILVAASENNVIGKNNQLPWHLPNDLKYFKNLTWGMPVIMGRKTFDSMRKPLPGRINIVVTSKKDWHPEGVIVASSPEVALAEADKTNCKEIFVIGGAEIIKQMMPSADKIYLTRVHANVEGDVVLAPIPFDEFVLQKEEDFKKDATHTYDYSFLVYKRKTEKSGT